jgi:RNA 2',3'-cyclic 3'-phosphodiesterase
VGAGQLEEEGPLTVRAFFGLPLPDPLREELEGYISACAGIAPGFRWTPASNLHLTIRFIGSVERDVVDDIARRLDELDLRGFEIELADIGVFKRGRRVRVVWIGLRAGGEEAVALAAQVEAECGRAGLAPESRPFQPHLTLARARDRDGTALPPLPSLPALPPWRAADLVLYSSHLGRPAAVYEPLQRLRLE